MLDKQNFVLERMHVREMFQNLEQGIELVCRKHGVVLHMDIEEGSIKADYDLLRRRY